MKCFRCGCKVEIEHEDTSWDYPLVCNRCDENMFIFECTEEYESEIVDMYMYVDLVKEIVKYGLKEFMFMSYKVWL